MQLPWSETNLLLLHELIKHYRHFHLPINQLGSALFYKTQYQNYKPSDTFYQESFQHDREPQLNPLLHYPSFWQFLIHDTMPTASSDTLAHRTLLDTKADTPTGAPLPRRGRWDESFRRGWEIRVPDWHNRQQCKCTCMQSRDFDN